MPMLKMLLHSDSHLDLFSPQYEIQFTSPGIVTKNQILVPFAVSLGSMIFGYSSAWSSPAIVYLMGPGSHIEGLFYLILQTNCVLSYHIFLKYYALQNKKIMKNVTDNEIYLIFIHLNFNNIIFYCVNLLYTFRSLRSSIFCYIKLVLMDIY
jgi:hypothetical protein